MNHGFIGTEHLLLGLIVEGEGVAAKALELLGVRLDDARAKVGEMIGPSPQAGPTGSPPFTPRSKKVLELALREALQLNHNYIGTEHILLGVAREGEGVGARVLVSLGADLERVRQQVFALLSEYPVSARRLRTPRLAEEAASAVGKSWTARVVRPGRGPAVFAAAYQELLELAQLDGDHDEANITIASVDTEQGAGIELSFTHYVDGDEDPAEDDEDDS